MTDRSAANSRGYKKVMRSLDLTLFTVCAILVIDQLAASAAIGPQAVFWWIFTMIFFFLPYGLITAELGSTYPDQGGIYAWVRRAFGPRWGGRTAWLWWINVALWQPSVFILFAGIFAALFMPDLGLWTQIAIAIALTWLTVWINVVRLDVGKWVPNIGAVFKAAIMLVIGIGGFLYAANHGVANELTFSSMAPSWGASLAFLPVIVYNFMGFELMSGASAEMKNPARDVPVTIAVSGILIAAFYLFATIGILIALPLDEINLVSGIVDTLRVLLGEGGGIFVVVLGIMALYTFLANMVTWTMGANRSAAEAALDGNLPAMFARLHPEHKTPSNAAIVTGVVTSVVIVVYGLLAADAEDLFWTLFAFSSIVFLLPYLIMFLTFLQLRRIDAHRPRPYRVPGGKGGALVFALLCIAFIVQAIVFFIYTPGEFDMTYAASIIIGVAATVIVGELMIMRAKRVTASAG
ncbi:amino acid permease-associated region [Parvibaculum lavamentivorans DS-1]|uniref:Amino acid permease-associated region n=1 Tax=Parvibaculum lavamentivorans (strain DS-1 / DSM 13023 / NCIMB 13966) TaxID=402881 RepID=A7HS81_PARL1|nr:APC family permease [Parvibaculum lavamentivorans]ABS62764.1 amino acid permease-associated region [Parvibaculum lavamentivorans DS-1]